MAIVKALTFVLNHVITTCVMNQSQEHYLQSNALNTCINLTLTLEAEVGQATNVFDALDTFNVELNAVIPLLMTMFEVLNPTIEACAIEVVGYVVGFGDSI